VAGGRKGHAKYNRGIDTPGHGLFTTGYKQTADPAAVRAELERIVASPLFEDTGWSVS
jgi:hypothetical protein